MPSPEHDALATRLTPVLTELVNRAGFDLEDVDVRPAGRRRLVRVIVDSDDGVGLDEIAGLSRAISMPLDDQDDVLGGPYTLEVTSPGVDRPLTCPGTGGGRGRGWSRPDCRTAARGSAGSGGPDDEAVELLVDGRVRRLSYPDVARAVVQVEFREPPPRSCGCWSRPRAMRTAPTSPRSRMLPAPLRSLGGSRRERRHRRAARDRAGQGHPVRHRDRGHRDRAAHRLPAHRGPPAARPDRHRPEDRRGAGAGPGAGRRRRGRRGSGTTPRRASAGSPPPPPARSSCSGCGTPSTSAPSASSPPRRARSSPASCSATRGPTPAAWSWSRSATTEGVIPPAEQVPGERYEHGERLRCYVVGVSRGRARHPDHAVPHPPQPGAQAVRAGGAGDRRRHGGDRRGGPGGRPPLQDRGAVHGARGERQGRLHRPDGRAGAQRDERAGRREDRHHRLLRGSRRRSSATRCRRPRSSR